MKGFKSQGCEIEFANYENFISGIQHKINTQMFRLPYRMRRIWENHYFRIINEKYLELYKRFRPDLILIYNNQMFHPDTIKKIKEKTKVVFFLGDSPYYTPTNNYNLTLLKYADLIISVDTFWLEQLKMLGFKKVIFEPFGFDADMNFEQNKNRDTDVLFIGNSYVNSWGYKRALFLSLFADFDLKIYGTKSWFRWFEYFPELRDKFILLNKPLTFSEVNDLSNTAKVYPVDSNPGLLHGLHIRIFDSIGSGILPLIEYRKDLEIVFDGMDIPVIKNYNEAKELAGFYLRNDNIRKETVLKLKDHLNKKYMPEMAANRVLEKLFC